MFIAGNASGKNWVGYLPMRFPQYGIGPVDTVTRTVTLTRWSNMLGRMDTTLSSDTGILGMLQGVPTSEKARLALIQAEAYNTLKC